MKLYKHCNTESADVTYCTYIGVLRQSSDIGLTNCFLFSMHAFELSFCCMIHREILTHFQVESDSPVNDANPHIVNIGRMVEVSGSILSS